MKTKNQCFKCSSKRCYLRIYRKDEPRFDEVACYKHINDLEIYADEVLGNPGHIRNHDSSSEMDQKRD